MSTVASTPTPFRSAFAFNGGPKTDFTPKPEPLLRKKDAGYAQKKTDQQIELLAQMLMISPQPALDFLKNVIPYLRLPKEAEGWFAIPSLTAAAHCAVGSDGPINFVAARFILSKFPGSFVNREMEPVLSSDQIMLFDRTAEALQMIEEKQPGGILLVPGQFGKRHLRKSVSAVCKEVRFPEFPAHTVGVAAMLLSHRDRLNNRKISIDVPGDMVKLTSGKGFVYAPVFYNDGYVGYDYGAANQIAMTSASATLFIPRM